MRLSRLLKRLQHVLIVNPASQPLALNQDQIKALNNDDPALQAMAIGSRLADAESEATLFAIVTSGNVLVAVPWACELIDMTIICTATHASGTIQAKQGSNAITDAVICASVGVVTRAGSIVATGAGYNVFAAGAVLSLVTANTPAGKVTLNFKRYQTPTQTNTDGT